MVQHQLFAPILNVVYETMPRDNLLNSVCLELFELIKRENIKPLIAHLVDTYRTKLEEITSSTHSKTSSSAMTKCRTTIHLKPPPWLAFKMGR